MLKIIINKRGKKMQIFCKILHFLFTFLKNLYTIQNDTKESLKGAFGL